MRANAGPIDPGQQASAPAEDTGQRLWRTLVGAAELLVRSVGRDLADQAGMPLAAFEVLVRLGEAPGGTLRMSELAACARSSRSRLSHTVDRLEAVGWVRREQCPSDRRGAFAVLTDLGASALAEARPVADASVARHLLAAFGREERRHLEDLAGQLLRHLDGELVAGAGECPFKTDEAACSEATDLAEDADCPARSAGPGVTAAATTDPGAR